MASIRYKSTIDSFVVEANGEEIYLDYAEVERAYLIAKKRIEDAEAKFEKEWKQQQ
jgi:hypothetical protein